MVKDEFPPIRERPVTPALIRAMGGHKCRVFQMGEVAVIVSRDQVGSGDTRWHLSISCQHREPTWEEIKHLQNCLKPGRFFCMPMPPEEFWISIHDHCYHLWEIKDTNLIEQWRFDGEERHG